MKALRRSNTSCSSRSSSSSSPSLAAGPSHSPLSWIHLRSLLIVASSPLPHRRSVSSPWSRASRRPLSRRRWRSLFTPEGKLRDGGVKFLRRAGSGGIDPSIKAEVWPFLLGVYDLDSSASEREIVRVRKRKEYEALRRRCLRFSSQDHKGFEFLGPGEFSRRENCCLDDIPESSSPEVYSPGVTFSHDRGSNHFDPPIYDVTPESRSCNLDEEDYTSSITIIDAASFVETASSESDSSFEEEPGNTEEIAYFNTDNENFPSNKWEHSVRTTEDFATWQRIIRLDALRSNAEWVLYSPPSQALVSEEKAQRSAAAVGMQDFDHLEPCMIHHAARLVAVLEAYAAYDPETGYCQGMSDLLSPILAIMEDDSEAFWCFVGFMKKARHNFRLDEAGIRRQLKTVAKIIQSKDSYLYRHLEALQAEDCFFVYRMVVVLFRRELTFDQTVSLWEVMWADQAAVRAGITKSTWGRMRSRAPPTDDLLLYAIAACVLQRRKLIMERSSSMDEIMRECHSLSGKLDVWRLLDDAHNLVVALHDKIK